MTDFCGKTAAIASLIVSGKYSVILRPAQRLPVIKPQTPHGGQSLLKETGRSVAAQAHASGPRHTYADLALARPIPISIRIVLSPDTYARPSELARSLAVEGTCRLPEPSEGYFDALLQAAAGSLVGSGVSRVPTRTAIGKFDITFDPTSRTTAARQSERSAVRYELGSNTRLVSGDFPSAPSTGSPSMPRPVWDEGAAGRGGQPRPSARSLRGPRLTTRADSQS